MFTSKKLFQQEPVSVVPLVHYWNANKICKAKSANHMQMWPETVKRDLSQLRTSDGRENGVEAE